MPTGLQHILNIGGESLGNSRMGIEITGHNISNAQTPGYSRQRPDMEANHPIAHGHLILGQGAKVGRVARAHDEFLIEAVRRENQNHGKAESLEHNISRLQSFFNPDLTATVRSRLDLFTNALRDFANMPEEPATRINLLETANSFTASINSTHANIVRLQDDISEELRTDCEMASQLINEVATLNRQVIELKTSDSMPPHDLEDKRDLALSRLSQLIDIQVYRDSKGVTTVRGADGHLLVEGFNSAEIRIDINNKQKHPQIVLTDFEKKKLINISTSIRSGKMAGMLEARDKYAQGIREKVNELARDFGAKFNEVHRSGFGRGEFSASSGRDFFEGLNDPDWEPAYQIRVSNLIQQDTDAISSAMAPKTPGDNVIANELIRAVQDPIFINGTSSTSEFYDNFVSFLGSATMTAKSELKTASIVKANAETMKEQVSGVSLDEEAANMLKYQHLFTASSRIIQTADEMFRTILDLKR
jgi:flagellar hook-associated protein 1 FlgK